MKTYRARVARTMTRGRLAYQIDGQVTLVLAADPDPETIVYDEATDTWDPIPGWATMGPQPTAPSWVAFQQRMNTIAAARGVPVPFVTQAGG